MSAAQDCKDGTQMPAADAVAQAIDLLDKHAQERERAMALAIVLRDRLERHDETSKDFTAIVLADMLVGECGGAPEHYIKQCLFALLSQVGKPRLDCDGGMPSM